MVLEKERPPGLGPGGALGGVYPPSRLRLDGWPGWAQGESHGYGWPDGPTGGPARRMDRPVS